MLKHVIRASEVNLDLAKKLVAEIPEERMCEQPSPGMNHAAWILGHLAYVFDSMIRVLGQTPSMSPEWHELFKIGSQPHSDRSKYPAKAELLETYERNYRRMVDAVQTVPAETLEREFPNPRLRPMLPTVGVAMAHVLCSHHGFHLGQLSTWRRALGMDRVTI